MLGHQALAGVTVRHTVLTVAGGLALALTAGIVLVVRSLRLRRAAHRSLIEREAHTRRILEAATDAFVSFGPPRRDGASGDTLDGGGDERLAAAPPGPSAGFRGTLLVVEGHSINQEVARGTVAKLGYGSDLAGDGIEALAALERRSYDAVLMDCHMPEMDGFEATAEIRRRETGQGHVLIIAMTAGAMAEDRDRCIAAGMDDYVSKPVKERDLEAVLNRWLFGGREPAHEEGLDPGPADAILDAVQFDSLRRLAEGTGDPAWLRSLVDQYLGAAGSQLAELRAAAASGDSSAVTAMAHGLKGTSATMGATGVASACESLEGLASRGEVAEPEGLDRIAGELERAARALHLRTDTRRSVEGDNAVVMVTGVASGLSGVPGGQSLRRSDDRYGERRSSRI